MDSFLNLTGIICELVVFSIFIFCGLKVREFSIKEKTFSHLGSIKETAKIFNLGLFTYLIFRSIFIGKILSFYRLWNNLPIISTYAICLLSVLLAIFFSVKKYELIHFILTRLAVLLSILFFLIFSIDFINRNTFLSIFNLVIFLWVFIVGIIFVLRRKTNGIYQIFFFTPILIWDWVMTLKLFNII